MRDLSILMGFEDANYDSANDVTLSNSTYTVNVVPEPSSLATLAFAVPMALVGFRRLRKS
jgi:hypothetical protein